MATGPRCRDSEVAQEAEWPLRDLHPVLSQNLQMNRAAAMRGTDVVSDPIVDWSKNCATGSVLEPVESGRDVALKLGNSVEADSGAESTSGNLCAEFGRDVVLDLIKRVAAASGREKLSGNVCAGFGRGQDIDWNMRKRVEADSGLEHFLGDPCAVFARDVGLNLSTRVEVTGSVFHIHQVNGTPHAECARHSTVA